MAQELNDSDDVTWPRSALICHSQDARDSERLSCRRSLLPIYVAKGVAARGLEFPDPTRRPAVRGSSSYHAFGASRSRFLAPSSTVPARSSQVGARTDLYYYRGYSGRRDSTDSEPIGGLRAAAGTQGECETE
jgi:hypothetical protein